MSQRMILVAGPYRSGTNDDPALIARNVAAMTESALRLFRAGHLPVIPSAFSRDNRIQREVREHGTR